MRSATTQKITIFVNAGIALILVLVPFHAFLTVWVSSVFGHYTLWRLWKEFLILPLTASALWLVLNSNTLRHEFWNSLLLKLMLAYLVLQTLLGLAAYRLHEVNAAALYQGYIEDTRLMVVFFVAWVAASTSPWLRAHWQKIVLIPAAVVVAFGLLQALVLPTDFLSHFGYGSATIPPYELVDLNSQYVRVQSTLRGANPLGAYLLVPIAVIACTLAFRLRERKDRDLIKLLVFGLAALVVLYFSYSRSAYAGAAIVVFGIVWLGLRSKRARQWSLVSALVLCVLVGSAVVLLRHNVRIEDTFFHTSQLSHSPHSSNQNRTTALENGLHDVAHEPFGHGPGTAGPASVHNNHPARIAENYYLQIGQEVGWLGLALFLAINVLVAKQLWQRRSDSDCLPVALFVSLLGLAFINLLSHAWTDDTLAYIWWGLAGIALAHIIKQKQNKRNATYTKAAPRTAP